MLPGVNAGGGIDFKGPSSESAVDQYSADYSSKIYNYKSGLQPEIIMFAGVGLLVLMLLMKKK